MDLVGLIVKILDAAARKKIERIESKVNDSGFRGLYNAVGSSIANEVRKCFKSGVSPWGDKWDPVARGGQPLRLTGRLNRSIQVNATTRYAVVSTNVKYSKVHQFGATIVPIRKKILAFEINGRKIFAKKVKIKARPFFPITKNGNVQWPPFWKEKAIKAAINYIDGKDELNV